MRNSEKIYDKSKTIIQTSSDVALFEYPEYDLANIGAMEIGLTPESTNVFIIEEEMDIPLSITFISNLDYLDDTVLFNYQILPYNSYTELFETTTLINSTANQYVDINHEDTVNSSQLTGEGEYIFKLGYNYNVKTLIARKLGKRDVATTYNDTLPYGNYDINKDKYFVMLYKAEEPLLDVGIGAGNGEGGTTPIADKISSTQLVAESGVRTYPLNISSSTEFIVTLGGLMLTKNQDYRISNNTITFLGPIKESDIINFIFIGKSNTSGLRSDIIDINSVISTGPTDGQGDKIVYYNEETSKYEIYTEFRITAPNTVVVMINGLTMTNLLDFHVSTSNMKRIILEGELKQGDLITVIYDSGENQQRGVTEGHIDISWYVNKPITNINGNFTIEFSKDKEFTDIIQSEEVSYIPEKQDYTKRVELDYEFGQVLFYRIKNNKFYTTILGDELNTENFSDSMRIEIKTNISNNY